MPPCCAMAMASRFSVTVSIAALRSGTLSRMLRVSRELTSTWLGRTVRVPRHEQHVVEREGRGQADRDLVGVQNVRACFHAVLKRQKAANALLPSVHSCLRPGASRPIEGLVSSCAMTLLVLLAAAARTGIVAADLRLVALDLADRVVAAGPRRPRCSGSAASAPLAGDGAERRRWRRLLRVQRHRPAGAAAAAAAPARRARRSSPMTGVSRHRYRTISSSIRSFIAWNSAKLSFLYSTSGSRWP